jgi:hypothetical protein
LLLRGSEVLNYSMLKPSSSMWRWRLPPPGAHALLKSSRAWCHRVLVVSCRRKCVPVNAPSVQGTHGFCHNTGTMFYLLFMLSCVIFELSTPKHRQTRTTRHNTDGAQLGNMIYRSTRTRQSTQVALTMPRHTTSSIIVLPHSQLSQAIKRFCVPSPCLGANTRFRVQRHR